MRPRHWKPVLLGLSCVASFPAVDRLAAFDPDAPPAAEPNGFVGLYADPEGTQPCIQIPRGTFGSIYIIVTNQGATAAGFAGAEFRVEVSHPEGYIFTFLANPDAPAVLGNPMDLTPGDPTDRAGVNIAFAACQTVTGSAGDRISLGTLQVINHAGGPTQLQVKRKSPPTNPGAAYPLFNRCDAPRYTAVPMRQCKSSDFGESIAFETSLNDPECTGTPACAQDCPGMPAVALTTRVVPANVCPGTNVELEILARNTSPGVESMEIFIDHESTATYAEVAPGDSILLVRPYVANCPTDPGRAFNVAAVARNASCMQAAGAEGFAGYWCYDEACNGPPTCARVRAIAPTNATVGQPFTVGLRVDAPSGGPVRNLFGVSGRLRFSHAEFVQALEFSCQNADGTAMDLGRDVLCFGRIDPDAGFVDFAVSRKAGAGGVDGSLQVARAIFTFRESTSRYQSTEFWVENVHALDPSGNAMCTDTLQARERTYALSPCTIWPGDTDNDGTVTEADIAALGAFYGMEGVKRDYTGCRWTWNGYNVDCWNTTGATWSDGFGDGRVGAEDILCIALNWNQTHEPAGPLVELPDRDPVALRAAYAEMLAYLEGTSEESEGIRAAKASLEKLAREAVPRAHALAQNVPNPFNPSTRIRVDVASPAHVKLEVFDVLGRRVRTLLDRDFDPGAHYVTWDGTDAGGAPAASGIYVYRARIGDRNLSRKMVLAR